MCKWYVVIFYRMADFCTIYNNRRILFKYNTPPTRYTPVSPYPQYTKLQLDMRRKAEILKFNATKSSTQTNAPTKAQRWAALVNGNSNSPFSQTQVEQTGTSSQNCPIVSTPTSSSGVPGPLTYLYEDPAVPLYMYMPPKPQYGIINQDITEPWNVVVNQDVFFLDGSFNTFYTLILQNVDQYSYIYSMEVSVAVHFTGTTRQASSGVMMDISIRDASYNTYYSNAPIANRGAPSISKKLTTTSILLPDASGVTFSVTQYVGNMTIDSVNLLTQSGYVYTGNLLFDLSYNVPANIDSVNYTAGAYAILSGYNTNVAQNCVLLTPPSSDPMAGFTFAGV